MGDNILEQNEQIEIDLGLLLRAVARRAWVILLAGCIWAAAVFGVTWFAVAPKYESSVLFYVQNGTAGENPEGISSGNLATARNLVESYIVVLNTRETLNSILQVSGAARNVRELEKMITAEAVSETEFFEVTVTGEDPVEAERIADAIADVLPGRIAAVMKGTSVHVADAAVLPTRASSPGYLKNTVIGFLLGLLLTVVAIVLRELLDVRIRREEDIARATDAPVLAAVPDMTVPGDLRQTTVGEGISPAALEAYRLLRTKLKYSFADNSACRVVGITSAVTGEGKSLTAVNLAVTLAQLKERVLLIDCDMRRPTLAEKLVLVKEPGLSGYLSGQCGREDLIQQWKLKDAAVPVIVAGRNPPNPVELLSSAKMGQLLAEFRECYDYILLDFPPVGVVSDALAMAGETDGILLVVRQGQCSRTALSGAVRQLGFVDARILGVVCNGTKESGKKNAYEQYYK